MELNEREMQETVGGAISWGTLSVIGGAVAFILGAISGYTNPNKCNN